MPPQPLARLWLPALIVSSIGTWILYGARPGINFLIWTGAAIVGLFYIIRRTDRRMGQLALPLGFAVLLAAGAAITADRLFHALIVLAVASLLGLSVVLAAAPPGANEYGPLYILTAPFSAFGRTVAGTIRTCIATFGALGTARLHPILRGALVAAPVAIIFALLFASADPVFARGRDAIAGAFSSWDFLPRLIFWSLLALFLLGAYAVVAMGNDVSVRAVASAPARVQRHEARTERLILLGTAAAVSWLFVLLQLAYRFGNPAAMIGSGVTFADYARRGFGELAIVATMAVGLIIGAEDLGRGADRGSVADPSLRATALILLAAVGGLLLSAVHRVGLYENAYGYTTARLYAQAYMGMVLIILLLVAKEVLGAFNTPRLARGIMGVALATLVALIYWNGDAWIARRSLDRFATTGRVDAKYLTAGLSPDAYPTLVDALPSLAEPTRTRVSDWLLRWGSPELGGGDAWYEWNSRRRDARAALAVLKYRMR
ncbi:MAG: DUF4153 domain-containing protein [Gemmatimonadaceae bacterium]